MNDPNADKMAAEAKKLGLGATGRYPLGKLGPDDQGELKVALTIKNGEVVLNFGTMLSWISMTPMEAMEFSIALARKAIEAATGTKP